MLEIDGLLKIKEKNFQSRVYDGKYIAKDIGGSNYIYNRGSGFLDWINERYILLKDYDNEYLIFDGKCLSKIVFKRTILGNRAFMDKECFNYVEEVKVISQPYDKKPDKLIQKLFSLEFKEIIEKNE